MIWFFWDKRIHIYKVNIYQHIVITPDTDVDIFVVSGHDVFYISLEWELGF